MARVPHLIRTSKFLSLVLRHRPELVGVQLDPAGWVAVETLIRGARSQGWRLTRELIEEVVATSPKRRFELSPDGRFIRATYGHSVPVELGYEPTEPPSLLYHGTVRRALASILATGLQHQSRVYVHLTNDMAMARTVGHRHGADLVLLRVAAGRMSTDGYRFYQAAPMIWLIEHVPPAYIELVNDDDHS